MWHFTLTKDFLLWDLIRVDFLLLSEVKKLIEHFSLQNTLTKVRTRSEGYRSGQGASGI